MTWAVSVVLVAGVLLAAGASRVPHPLGFSSSLRTEEMLLLSMTVGAGFTLLWFLVGRRRSIIIALAAIAVWLLVSARSTRGPYPYVRSSGLPVPSIRFDSRSAAYDELRPRAATPVPVDRGR